MSDTPLLVLLGALLVTAVFLAAAETALLRVSAVRIAALADGGSAGAKRLQRLLGRLTNLLNLILLLALLSQIGAATVTGVLAQRRFGNVGVTVASGVLTLVLFVYGEAIPKTFAVRHADRVALAVAAPLAVLERVLRPLVSSLVWFADLQMPGKGITMSPTVTEDELRLLASLAATEGEITEYDRELIERVFRFGDRRADDVMVPRTAIVAVPADTTVEDAVAVTLAAGHRRLPVYEGTIENITGLALLRDLMAVEDPAATRISEVATAPLVVPESKRLADLLRDMQQQQKHLAVVVDEYGGTAGLVTVEDVAEELLGSISDEPVRPDIEEVGEGRWLVDAAVPVEDLVPIVGDEVLEGAWNTAAGMVMGLAGRLLRLGEHVDLGGFRLRVVGLRHRRITRIEIERLARERG
jgi:CBS domain containing-hemolysin-like protein